MKDISIRNGRLFEIEVLGDEMSKEEQNAYIEYLERKYNRQLNKLEMYVHNDFVDLTYWFDEAPFERIKRLKIE